MAKLHATPAAPEATQRTSIAELVASLKTVAAGDLDAEVAKAQAAADAAIGELRSLQSFRRSIAWRMGRMQTRMPKISDDDALARIVVRLAQGKANVDRLAADCTLAKKLVRRLLRDHADAEGFIGLPGDEWIRRGGRPATGD